MSVVILPISFGMLPVKLFHIKSLPKQKNIEVSSIYVGYLMAQPEKHRCRIKKETVQMGQDLSILLTCYVTLESLFCQRIRVLLKSHFTLKKHEVVPSSKKTLSGGHEVQYWGKTCFVFQVILKNHLNALNSVSSFLYLQLVQLRQKTNLWCQSSRKIHVKQLPTWAKGMHY